MAAGPCLPPAADDPSTASASDRPTLCPLTHRHARPSNPPRTAAHSFNQDVRVHGAIETPDQAAVLSPDVLRLLSHLHYTLEPRRKALLLERRRRALEIDGGALPHFLEETRAIREDKSWRCAPIPACIQDRRVEITGPVDR